MFDFTEKSAEELEARAAELKTQISELENQSEEERSAENALENAEAMAEELRAIQAELKERREAAAEEQRRCDEAAKGGKTVKTFEEEKRMDKIYNAGSPEYRSAFLKTMKGTELNEEERAALEAVTRGAYTGTTTDTTANNHGIGLLVPTTMADNIWSLVEEQHAILGDITMYRTNTILSVPVHTAIAQGDATSVSEANANDDEINNFMTVVLNGVDYSKSVEISYAMANMGIDALEAYLTNEIGERLGAAMARDTITGILSDYYTTGATITALNSKLEFKDVADAFAALKNKKGEVVVYGNNYTIYKYLVGMVDTAGRPIFQVNAQDGAEGRLIGAAVKAEDALADNVLLVGTPKAVVGNVVTDVMIENDRDIKKHVIIYSGYARYESKLAAPKAFAKITVTSATVAG